MEVLFLQLKNLLSRKLSINTDSVLIENPEKQWFYPRKNPGGTRGPGSSSDTQTPVIYLKFLLFFMCACMRVCVNMCTLVQVSLEARRGPQIS